MICFPSPCNICLCVFMKELRFIMYKTNDIQNLYFILLVLYQKSSKSNFERFHKGGYLKNFDIKFNKIQLFNHNFTRIKNFDKLY